MTVVLSFTSPVVHTRCLSRDLAVHIVMTLFGALVNKVGQLQVWTKARRRPLLRYHAAILSPGPRLKRDLAHQRYHHQERGYASRSVGPDEPGELRIDP